MYVHMYTSIHKYICTYVPTYMYVCIYIRAYLCMYVCNIYYLHTGIYTHTHKRMCTYIHKTFTQMSKHRHAYEVRNIENAYGIEPTYVHTNGKEFTYVKTSPRHPQGGTSTLCISIRI